MDEVEHQTARAEEATELSLTVMNAVRGTAEHLSDAADKMDATAQTLLEAARPTRSEKVLMIVAVLLAAGSALGSAIVVHDVKRQSNDLLSIAETNRANGEDIKRTADQIESCTTPGGECHERNEQATANAIAVLQKYTLIAVECAHEPSDALIEACVLRKSREQGLVK